MSLKKMALLINCIIATQRINANDFDLLTLNAHLNTLAQPSGIYVTTADGAEIFFPQALIDSKSVASEFLTKTTSQHITTKAEGPIVELLRKSMAIFRHASEATDERIVEAIWKRFDTDIGSNSLDDLTKLHALAAKWNLPLPFLQKIARLKKAAATAKPTKKD